MDRAFRCIIWRLMCQCAIAFSRRQSTNLWRSSVAQQSTRAHLARAIRLSPSAGRLCFEAVTLSRNDAAAYDFEIAPREVREP